MTAEQKAKELIEKFKPYVSGYIGSSMLTNTEYPEQVLKQAKQCALICVDEIIDNETRGFDIEDCHLVTQDNVKFWQEVKQELLKQ